MHARLDGLKISHPDSVRNTCVTCHKSYRNEVSTISIVLDSTSPMTRPVAHKMGRCALSVLEYASSTVGRHRHIQSWRPPTATNDRWVNSWTVLFSVSRHESCLTLSDKRTSDARQRCVSSIYCHILPIGIAAAAFTRQGGTIGIGARLVPA